MVDGTLQPQEPGTYCIAVYEGQEYEPLFRPDGTILSTLTEPEDRTWYRDIGNVVVELNVLYAENERLRKALVALKRGLFSTTTLVDLAAAIDAALAPGLPDAQSIEVDD